MWQYVRLNNKRLRNTFVNQQICHKMQFLFGPVRSLINLLILDKAQKMARGVPVTNIYNMSTNNWSPNSHLTNTVSEWKSVTHRRTDRQMDRQTLQFVKLLLAAKKVFLIGHLVMDGIYNIVHKFHEVKNWLEFLSTRIVTE